MEENMNNLISFDVYSVSDLNLYSICKEKNYTFHTSGSISTTALIEIKEFLDLSYCRIDSEDETTTSFIYEIPNGLISLNKQFKDLSWIVWSNSKERLLQIVSEIKAKFPEMQKEEGKIDIKFFYWSGQAPACYSRRIKVNKWNDIVDNYPTILSTQLTSLMDYKPKENETGKLILWRGEPGTGKTHSIRALAESWKDWAEMVFIMDPEKFLSIGAYLNQVVIDNNTSKYKVILLEDSGEFLCKEAKHEVGQGMSRLLNICDGLIGQELKLIFLVTTNEELGKLHEAVVRPGRCLSEIEFTNFSTNEAEEWLKNHGKNILLKGKSYSLAELYAIINGTNQKEGVKFLPGFGSGVQPHKANGVIDG